MRRSTAAPPFWSNRSEVCSRIPSTKASSRSVNRNVVCGCVEPLCFLDRFRKIWWPGPLPHPTRLPKRDVDDYVEGHPQIDSKSVRNRFQIGSRGSLERPRAFRRGHFGSEPILAPILTPVWDRLGTILGPFWASKRSKMSFGALQKASS